MNYTKAQSSLVLPSNVGNDFCFAMPKRGGKHPKQIRSNGNNLITVAIAIYNDTTLYNLSIGLINCQSICNKSINISDVIKDM